MLTKNELLGRSQHVKTESHFVLVLLQFHPAQQWRWLEKHGWDEKHEEKGKIDGCGSEY